MHSAPSSHLVLSRYCKTNILVDDVWMKCIDKVEPTPLPYLRQNSPYSFDINLEVGIQSESMMTSHLLVIIIALYMQLRK